MVARWILMNAHLTLRQLLLNAIVIFMADDAFWQHLYNLKIVGATQWINELFLKNCPS